MSEPLIIANDQFTAHFCRQTAQILTFQLKSQLKQPQHPIPILLPLNKNTATRQHGGAPLLFPFAGRSYSSQQLRPGFYQLDGCEYPMPLHGFAAWDSAWTIINQTTNTVAFRYTSNQESLSSFPFHFALELTYELSHGGLLMKLRITHGKHSPKERMPLAVGWHPYFALEFFKSAKASEALKIAGSFGKAYAVNAQGLADADISEAIQKILSKEEHLTSPELHNIILECSGANAKISNEANTHAISISASPAKMFPYMVGWSLKSKGESCNFYCLEPWMALPNALSSDQAHITWLDKHAAIEVAFTVNVNHPIVSK